MNKYYPEGYLIKQAENDTALSDIEQIKKAKEDGKILEAKVKLCDSEHNLILDIKGVRAIIPRDEGAIGILEGKTKDIALISKVNKSVCFKIMEIIEEENSLPKLILSRKEAQLECFENYIKSLVVGDIIPAKITHLEQFGCFVDIACGIPSLIPIDLISVSRISHPDNRFVIGENIYAVIKALEDQKVFLSHKELLGTWEENAENFSVGETVTGVVRSIENYGIFIELAPNLAGLAEPRDNVFIGQSVSVYIKSMIPEKMKVKLIIVDLFDKKLEKTKINYYIKASHIDVWQYSPNQSERLIETIF